MALLKDLETRVGTTHKDIAKISDQLRAIQALVATMRAAEVAGQKPATLEQIKIGLVREAKDRGLYIREIAVELDVSERAVCRWLKKWRSVGVEI